MDERKQDERMQDEQNAREAVGRADGVEDLDVAEREGEDVKGGYTIVNAWPKKYSG